MFLKLQQIAAIALVSVSLFSCASKTEENTAAADKKLRIVSLSGAVSETLAALGMEDNLAGIDVTSTYPASLQSKPKVGNTHNLNVESILALKPDYVISMKERGIKPEQATQLQQAGIKVWVIEQEYSIEGTKKYVMQLADSFHKEEAGKKLTSAIDAAYASLPSYTSKPSVMFIYARGAGALSVCGKDMPVAKMIGMAGGINAANETEGFKPLTAEAVVKADPEAILLFNSGLQSLDGPEGMLKVPGIAQTRAGKKKNFIVMDGELLSAFGPRVVEGIKELGTKIHASETAAAAKATATAQ